MHNSSMRILDLADFKIHYNNNLGKTTSGSDSNLSSSAHDVWTATHKSTNEIVVVKNVSMARIGFGPEQEEINYPPKQAKELAATEVLALKLGKLFSSSQFPSANIATDGSNYFVVSKFIDNAVTLKSILKANHIYEEDRDSSVISLEPHKDLPLKTKAHIQKDTILEYLKLTPDLERKMQRKDFKIGNAPIDGRIALKIILYILGEIDELHNRDGNVLLRVNKYHIDEKNKIITPEVTMMGIDLGLCLKLAESKEGMIEKAYNLATKEKDSLKMGLELDGNPATNLKPTKDAFLKTLIPIYESHSVDQYIDQASEYLDSENMEFIEAAKTRFTICYLAAKCIEAELDKPENKPKALEFIQNLLTEQQERQVPQQDNCMSL